MSGLSEEVSTPVIFLILAGLVMVVTLWFSKKAMKVTDTEINLGRQDSGNERFSPNFFSRGIVRYFIMVGDIFQSLIPESLSQKMSSKFEKKDPAEVKKGIDAPSFVLIRASVNLVVASVLISIATNLIYHLRDFYGSNGYFFCRWSLGQG